MPEPVKSVAMWQDALLEMRIAINPLVGSGFALMT
jgi:hypothetical protein